MPDLIFKYNVWWPEGASALEIERECIRQGGRWTVKGKERGAGLFEHFKAFFDLCWPEDHHNRWSDLILSNLVTNRLTVVAGPKNSQKTRTGAKWALTKYWASPSDTQVLLTSTDRRGLQQRILGDIKSLFERARRIHSQLEGNFVEAHDAIFTDALSTGEGTRDWRRGIIGVPILSSTGDFQGLAIKNFAGIKQEHRVLLADEIQFVPVEYLKVLDSLDDGDFAACMLLNPIAGNGKAGDRVSEPIHGWGSIGEVTKTTTWKNKYGGVTVQLVGTDSPNFDIPLVHYYKNLIDRKMADAVASRPGGKDSREWWSLIMGVRKSGVLDYRVLTVELVESNHGFDDCKWEMEPEIKVIGIDAGFGGDPCILTWAMCGKEVGKGQVMRFGDQEEIPIVISPALTPEKQIALYVKKRCDELGVAPEGVFAECGMRATLMQEMALIVGVGVNAVNAGGPATQRPVHNEFYIDDEKTGQKRLKTCYEHYSKFVTELSFTVRELVIGGQARKFPIGAAEEFEQRESRDVYNNRIELETKREYKERMGAGSPNLSDSAAITVEGARRMGFVLERVSDGTGQGKAPERDWLGDAADEQEKLESERELIYD